MPPVFLSLSFVLWHILSFLSQSNKLQSYYLFIIVVFNVAGLWWGFGLFFPAGIWQIFPCFYRPILKLRRSNISIKWITSTWNWFVTLKIKERCKSAVQCDWCRKYVDYFFTHLCSWHTNTSFCGSRVRESQFLQFSVFLTQTIIREASKM